MERKCYALGQCTYNTGDGVRMAAQAGANLWGIGRIVRHNDCVDGQTDYAPSAWTRRSPTWAPR